MYFVMFSLFCFFTVQELKSHEKDGEQGNQGLKNFKEALLNIKGLSGEEVNECCERALLNTIE